MKTIRHLSMMGVVALAWPSAVLVVAQDQKADPKPGAEKPNAPAKPKTEREIEEEKQVAAQMRQFLPQLRPFLLSEVELVSFLCKPTKEQRAGLEKEGDAALQEVARGIAKAQMNLMAGRWTAGSSTPDPRGMFQAAMLKAVKSQLAPEQVARYQVELDKRAADRKRAAVRNIVAQMDMDLILTADQRQKLAASISENWNDKWCSALENCLYGAAYMPNIPAKLTDPILNDAQKKVWKATPRGQEMFFGGMGILGNMVQFDGLAVELDVEGVKAEEIKEEAEKGEAKPGEKKP